MAADTFTRDQVRMLKARLRYIQRIACGKIRYASDFGRLCTIERVSRSSRLPVDLRSEVKRHAR